MLWAISIGITIHNEYPEIIIYLLLNWLLLSKGSKVINNNGNKAPRIIDSVNAVNKICENDLIIDPRCKGLITDLEQTVNKEGTREIDKSNKDRTHFSDGLRYAIDYEYPIIKPITGSIQRWYHQQPNYQ